MQIGDLVGFKVGARHYPAIITRVEGYVVFFTVFTDDGILYPTKNRLDIIGDDVVSLAVLRNEPPQVRLTTDIEGKRLTEVYPDGLHSVPTVITEVVRAPEGGLPTELAEAYPFANAFFEQDAAEMQGLARALSNVPDPVEATKSFNKEVFADGIPEAVAEKLGDVYEGTKEIATSVAETVSEAASSVADSVSEAFSGDPGF